MKEIKNYPGYYADEQGEIYSNRSGELRQLSKRIHKGYYHVNIRDTNCPAKKRPVPVHTLVLNAFVGARPAGYVCRHLNGDPLDNSISNICWGTQKENVQDSIRHGTAVCLRCGEQSIAAKLSLKDVLRIREMHAEGYKQKEIAKMFPVCQRHIGDIIRGKTWKATLGEV